MALPVGGGQEGTLGADGGKLVLYSPQLSVLLQDFVRKRVLAGHDVRSQSLDLLLQPPLSFGRTSHLLSFGRTSHLLGPVQPGGPSGHA